MATIANSRKLTLRVLIAMCLGCAFGVFFGDYSKIWEPIGDIYVMMLQSVIYPYLISSLIFGLGSMDKAMAIKFFKKGWVIYLGLIGICVCVIYALVIDVPQAQSHIITISTLNSSRKFLESILSNIIPANPLKAIVNNAIPAVVLISILYGIALQHFKNKALHLSLFESIMHASLTIWGWVIFLAPIGVFAMIAYFSGTVSVANIEGVAIFLALFFVGCLFLTFLLLPLLISSLTPLSFMDVLRHLQSALLISLVTTLSVVAIPLIAAATHSILQKYVPSPGKKEPHEEIINPALSISYPLCQLGNLFLLLFVFFCLFFFNRSISFAQEISLPILSYLSSIGSPSASVNAIQFLSSSMNLPQEATELYVALISLTRYPQVLASVMGMAFFTILFAMHYYNQIKIRWHRLLLTLLCLVLLVFATLGAKQSLFGLLKSQRPNLMTFVVDPSLRAQVDATIYTSREEAKTVLQTAKYRSTSLDAIQKRGVLIVGYHAYTPPWCYFNRDHELVGYDVACMYKLATNLRVKLIFIPYAWEELMNNIMAKEFDIGIGAIYVATDRLEKVDFTDLYYHSNLSLIVRDDIASHFYSIEEILQRKKLKVAVIDDPEIIRIARWNFLENQIVLLDNYHMLPKQKEIDAALWTQEITEAWVTIHPGYASIIPHGMLPNWPLAMAYMINKESTGLKEFLNYWMKLPDIEDFNNKQYRQWLLRQPLNKEQPRWSVLHNVLHWVD